jgi:hypothetical protein
MAQIKVNPIPLPIRIGAALVLGDNHGHGHGAGAVRGDPNKLIQEHAQSKKDGHGNVNTSALMSGHDRRRRVRFADISRSSAGESDDNGGGVTYYYQCAEDEEYADYEDHDEHRTRTHTVEDHHAHPSESTAATDMDTNGGAHVSMINGNDGNGIHHHHNGIGNGDNGNDSDEEDDVEVITNSGNRGIGEFRTHSHTVNEVLDDDDDDDDDDEKDENDTTNVVSASASVSVVVTELDRDDEEFVEDMLLRYQMRKRHEKKQSNAKKDKSKLKSGATLIPSSNVDAFDNSQDDDDLLDDEDDYMDSGRILDHAVEEELAEEQPWEAYLRSDVEHAKVNQEYTRRQQAGQQFLKARQGWEMEVECEAFARRLIRHTDVYYLTRKKRNKPKKSDSDSEDDDSDSDTDSSGDEEEERKAFLANEPETLQMRERGGGSSNSGRGPPTSTSVVGIKKVQSSSASASTCTPTSYYNVNEWRQLLPSKLHEIEQSSWEHKIVWDHGTGDTVTPSAGGQRQPPMSSSSPINNRNTSATMTPTKQLQEQVLDPDNNKVEGEGGTTDKTLQEARPMSATEELLDQPLNHEFETMDFSAAIQWDDGNDSTTCTANTNIDNMHIDIPLILAKGLAGTSVARFVAPTTAARTRPLPLSQSDVYLHRMNRELKNHEKSGGGGGGGGGASLNQGGSASKEDNLERFIAQKQKKRERMAIDKTRRVLDAMGTMDIGGGQGRTITSSLMGPGGTERTGRPTKGVVGASSLAYDAEQVEHLELIFNHHLVKPDFKRADLRHYHRPRLTRMIVQGDSRHGHHNQNHNSNHGNSNHPSVVWQLQLLVDAGAAAKGASSSSSKNTQNPHSQDGSTVVTSALIGTHPGALSQTRLRNETDLTASEGQLILLEYCEERPPLFLSKGYSCKIVNYYRGDKKKCPISLGGGDRPPKLKRSNNASGQNMMLTSGSSKLAATEGGKPKLEAPTDYNVETVTDLIGAKKVMEHEMAKRNASNRSGGALNKPKKKEHTVEILTEGVTEILLPKVHGPFIGIVDEGTIQSGLISNMFVAPVFHHKPQSSDFLLIFQKKPRPSAAMLADGTQTFGVMIRPMPKSVFCCGQTEPRVRVFAPNTTGEKNFLAPFQTYQIAKYLTRTETMEGQGLRFDEISDRLFTNTRILQNALRQRIKQVAIYDKNTQIWTSKRIGFEEYPGVEALGRRFSPESIQAYESSCACVQRLADLGIVDIYNGNSVQVVGQALMYLNGAVSAARERKSKMKKMAENAKSLEQKQAVAASHKKKGTGADNNNIQSAAALLYEEAARRLELKWKEYKLKQEIARFIYAELVLAPWNMTQDFIEVHKHAQGSGMMKLSGVGDPSGRLEGFNFMREADLKPSKQAALAAQSHSEGALSAQIKKITGTENDLRKLTMKEMASLLRSYGMQDKQIATLKRWDRVHCIRDLSTKAASDGMGDGMERYARGEKLKLADQKQMYRDRIQEIWRRQRSALSSDAGAFDAADKKRKAAATAAAAAKAKAKSDSASAENESVKAAQASDESTKQGNGDSTTNEDSSDVNKKENISSNKPEEEEESDSDDDDDLVDMLEEGMMDGREANRIMADQLQGDKNGAGDDSGALRDDARDLAAFLRQKEEERNATQGLLADPAQHKRQMDEFMRMRDMKGRKCVRRRITKTHPDGTQVTTFKFVVDRHEVEKVTEKKRYQKEEESFCGKNNASMNPSMTILGELVGGKSNAAPTKKGRGRAKKDKIKPGLKTKSDYVTDVLLITHAMYEEDAEDVAKPNMKLSAKAARAAAANSAHHKGPKGSGGMSLVKKATTKKYKTASGKLVKEREKAEKKKKKRKREEEEADLYTAGPHRRGANVRRERGSIRERKPHVMLADRLETIREQGTSRYVLYILCLAILILYIYI